MYRFLGPESLLAAASRLAEWSTPRSRPRRKAPPTRDEVAHLARPLARAIAEFQPEMPVQTAYGVELVDDKAFEDRMIAGFLQESILDDLERYRDLNYFENGPERRAQIQADVAYVDEALTRFQRVDPDFWAVFGLFVRYIMCPYSPYSRGGTDSAVRGTIFLSGPRQYSERDLYELLVHEFTHTTMFVDELSRPHYADIRAVADPRNFCLGAVTGLKRPLDKVLHSLVVAAEVLLHRDAVIGHDESVTVHPPTPELIEGMRRSVASIEALDDSRSVLTPHGLALVRRSLEVAEAH